jgi:hypothetical protein
MSVEMPALAKATHGPFGCENKQNVQQAGTLEPRAPCFYAGQQYSDGAWRASRPEGGATDWPVARRTAMYHVRLLAATSIP